MARLTRWIWTRPGSRITAQQTATPTPPSSLSVRCPRLSRTDTRRSHASADTNVLISQLALLKSLVARLREERGDSEETGLPQLCIPRVVVSELDGLKSSQQQQQRREQGPGHGREQGSSSVRGGARRLVSSSRHASSISDGGRGGGDRSAAPGTIGTAARDATRWLLDELKRVPQHVRGQRIEERFIEPGHDVDGGRLNDDAILDACLYWHKRAARRTVLLSNDQNLCVKAQVEGASHSRSWFTVWAADSLFAGLRTCSLQEPRTPKELYEALVGEEQLSPMQAQSPTQAEAGARARATLEPTTSDEAPIEVDAAPVPRLEAPGPLALEPPRDAYDLIANASVLVAHYTSLVLCHYALAGTQGRLRTLKDKDWQRWTAEDCLTLAREHWHDGVEVVCARGLANAHKPHRLVGDLFDSLPVLARTFTGATPEIVRTWRPMRWTVLFDQLELFLLATLNGMWPTTATTAPSLEVEIRAEVQSTLRDYIHLVAGK